MLLTMNKKTSIFQCSKNYSSLTSVTRFKVVVNMADPNSLMDRSGQSAPGNEKNFKNWGNIDIGVNGI